MNILLGVTGSVAAILVHKLQNRLKELNYSFKTVVTDAALNFNNGDQWEEQLTDEDEWKEYKFKKKVLHIDLIKWADVFLVAPCTANTIAKLANGFSDNLLSSCALAWNYNKPMLIAPAMNCNMLSHPATNKNIETIINFGAEIIKPQEKFLFCKDRGNGAMAEIEEIIENVQRYEKEKL